MFLSVLLLSVITMTVSGQHSRDSVTILRTDALRKLAQADSLKIYKQLVQAQRADIDTLLVRGDQLYGIAKSLDEKDRTNQSIIKLKDEQAKVRQDQLNAALDNAAQLNKQVKKEKRKRRWLGAALMAGVVGSFYLGLQL